MQEFGSYHIILNTPFKLACSGNQGDYKSIFFVFVICFHHLLNLLHDLELRSPWRDRRAVSTEHLLLTGTKIDVLTPIIFRGRTDLSIIKLFSSCSVPNLKAKDRRRKSWKRENSSDISEENSSSSAVSTPTKPSPAKPVSVKPLSTVKPVPLKSPTTVKPSPLKPLSMKTAPTKPPPVQPHPVQMESKMEQPQSAKVTCYVIIRLIPYCFVSILVLKSS